MKREQHKRIVERLMLDCRTEQEIADLSTDFNNLLKDFMEQIKVSEESNKPIIRVDGDLVEYAYFEDQLKPLYKEEMRREDIET